MKKHQITAFYLETLLLIAVFIAIILVLTQLFGASRAQSRDAVRLTNAVILAENAAEAVSASRSPEEVARLLDEGGNTRLENGTVEAGYRTDMTPDAGDSPALRVTVTWEPSPDDPGLVMSRIRVTGSPGGEIYFLQTAVSPEEVAE